MSAARSPGGRGPLLIILFETRPDGTSVASETGPDPCFGLFSRVTTLRTTTTPGGLLRTESHARAVVLSDPADPLSALLSETETVTINGRTSTMTYDAVARTLTRTSPLGRAVVSTLDARGRVIEHATGGLLPTAFAYDLEGRLSETTRGTRTSLRTYDGYGRLAAVTDPIVRTTSFAGDALGRVTEETRLDGAVTAMAYDAGGNLLSLTPPAQPAHALVYAASDMLASYAPSGADPVQYSYDVDRKLTTATVGTTPTGNYAYDSRGRLATTTDASSTVSRNYDPVTGKLASLAGPGNVTIAFGYDGALLTDRVYSGDVSGTVHFQHDDDFRIAQQSVAGDTVTLGYDDDGLLAQTGDLAIARDAASGLPTGTTLGVVTDAYSYNGHGEVVAYSASAGGVSLLDLSYARDALGRIVEKTERVEGGAPTVETYEYDLAGRLVRVTRDGGVAAEYAYDPNGNRLSATEYAVSGDLGSAVETAGTYDADDALLAYGGATYDHDALGARAHKYGPGARGPGGRLPDQVRWVRATGPRGARCWVVGPRTRSERPGAMGGGLPGRGVWGEMRRPR
ncbi:MAG: RHS repeat protein [Myxococcales bacterium]|nr:RHS repeat protein [Myxococcales bacterium]